MCLGRENNRSVRGAYRFLPANKHLMISIISCLIPFDLWKTFFLFINLWLLYKHWPPRPLWRHRFVSRDLLNQHILEQWLIFFDTYTSGCCKKGCFLPIFGISEWPFFFFEVWKITVLRIAVHLKIFFRFFPQCNGSLYSVGKYQFVLVGLFFASFFSLIWQCWTKGVGGRFHGGPSQQ